MLERMAIIIKYSRSATSLNYAKVVIAVVPGWAVGGGHSLHVVCDLTLASKSMLFLNKLMLMSDFDGGYGSAYLAKMVGQRKQEIFF